ncbi:sodium:dicarboxylate symporter [Novosphingobium sp. Rr 2-17]|uniref:dicarboxylate/amino acid:cation symporter n=1 Tax=Novosphingobium sp. Rr 2-17 TaxID=555793 RepID=UPI0002697F00|nr:cation:dicarboxylase symporter family transporter [Novosphingobium sp. Rr 2-17]EIZ77690.1 sodium:dicarboxylate symporter [Novosphingobium sp. Rr 2-17]
MTTPPDALTHPTVTDSPSRLPEIRVPGKLTLAGLVAGLILGLLVAGKPVATTLLEVAGPIGSLWLQGLQMTILPLVAGLLFTGIVATVAAARGGAMARRTLGIIVGFLAFSAVLGAVMMPTLLRLFPVPAGVQFSHDADPGKVPGLSEFLASLLPDNVISAAAASAMLPVIVFVTLFALASTRLADEPRRLLATLFEGLAGAMMVVIGWVLMLAPIGVFALGLSLGVRSGGAALGALAHYVVLVVAVGAVVMLCGYVLAATLGRQRIGAFVAALIPAQVVAISTQSSIATLPAMLASSRKLNLAPTTSEFALPLAVTLFRATGPAMNMAVAVYAAKLAGLELTTGALAAGAFVAFATTFGAVSLPGTISFVSSIGPIAAAMGVPLWPLGVLVAVEVLPDLMRTVGNVTMDVALASAVDTQGSSGDAADEAPVVETVH